MTAERVHHSKRPKFCPLCELYDTGNESVERIQHKELIPIQRGQYSLKKKQIEKQQL